MPNRLRNFRTFSSLKNRAFRIYYVGMIGQWSSMNMQIVARSLLIYRISDSGAILGLSALANAIPTIIFSLYGGALADRVQKRDILLYGMIGSMFVSLAVALSLMMGYLSESIPNSWWILVVTATIQGTIMGLMMPSRQAIIAEMVDREQVMNAVSLNMMGMNSFRILAPAATGFIIEAYDFTSVYYISAAMYAVGSVCMFILPRTTQQFSQGANALADILDGFKYIRREKTMMLVLVATIAVMICGIPFMQLMPMITEDILKVGASGMGILLSVSGAGAIVGSLILASLPNKKRGTIMLISGIIMGLALVGFAFSRWWLISILVVIFIGLGQSGQRTAGNSLAQNYTEPEYRGRVMSFMMMGIGFSSLGTFFAGILAEAIGIQWSIGGLAVILVVASLALLILTPRLRKLEGPSP
jgi:MFS family permease